MWLYRLPLLVGCGLLLAGCGFKPLYGTQAGALVLYELSSIKLAPVKGVIGVQLHNALHDNLRANKGAGAARYNLTLEYDKSTYAMLTSPNTSQITRYTMILTVDYELTDSVTRNLVKSGQTSTHASYNVINDNVYATFVAEEEAVLRAARQVAQQLINLLSMHFSQGNRNGIDGP
jgi:LPS-assembly lipoprotein